MNLQQHPLSAAFPAMSAEDFQALTDSIENIGVQNPITLFEGMVIDGWHRYRAASDLGVDCPSKELAEWIDPVAFVRAQNKDRRHLPLSAWALIEVSLRAWKPSHRPDKGELSSPLQASNQEMADAVGVTTRTIQQAKAVQTTAAPEVIAAVKSGAIGLPKAAAIAKLPQAEQAAAIHKPAPAAKPALKASKPAAEPEPENHDLAEAVFTINELSAENEQLRDRLAVEAMDASEEEKTSAAEIIAELRQQVRTLEAELDATRASRDGFQRQNSELMKQVQMQQRQLKKAA
jgi:hypothetical protein